MTASSAAGEKLQLLVIGKLAKPRCFCDMILGTLPVTYRANHRAWMTSELFTDWLNKVNNMMILQKCKMLMFVDSCSTHSTIELTIMKLKFFPPNTTSHLQPCDAGITQTLKAHYRCHLLHHITFTAMWCWNHPNTDGSLPLSPTPPHHIYSHVVLESSKH